MEAVEVEKVTNHFSGASLYMVQIINLIIAISYLWFCWKIIVFVCKKGEGLEVPLWVLIIIFIPLIGAWAAYIHYKSKIAQS